ncbi:hypothetical protein EVAR_44134_1 [Eumeta japonica]|uniref:Uncharacterized protein n=1 Tax=Eumeta variegata TaxID=151549 RepID=A0A4C1XJU7_EUMVA|nr:hypothetical protein EVAR_44134_1 [Eumeta japonica]
MAAPARAPRPPPRRPAHRDTIAPPRRLSAVRLTYQVFHVPDVGGVSKYFVLYIMSIASELYFWEASRHRGIAAHAMDTRNPQGVTSVLPISWNGIGCLMERVWVDETGEKE